MHILAVSALVAALALLFVLLPVIGLHLLLRVVARPTAACPPEPTQRQPQVASAAERPTSGVGQLRLIS